MSRIEAELAEVQSEIAVNAFIVKDEYKVPEYKVPKFLTEFMQRKAHAVELAMGSSAYRLVNFLQTVDVEHPDIATFIPEVSINILAEYSVLCDYLKANSLKLISPSIKNLCNRDIRDRLGELDTPKATYRNIRLLKDADLRNQIRAAKIVRNINFSGTYREGEWDLVQDSFRLYVRFGSAVDKEMEKAKTHSLRYKQMGCDSLYRTVEASITVFQRKMQETFMGFKPITFQDAAAILAKIHGAIPSGDGRLRFPKTALPITPGRVSNESSNIQFTSFGSNSVLTSVATAAVGSYAQAKAIDFPFCCRSYSWEDVKKASPSESTVKLIHHVENLPELSGKTAFDNIQFLLPTIDVGVSCPYEYTGADGKINAFGIAKETEFAFDMDLIRSGKIIPVIIGERDGKYYFLSLWDRG